MRAWGRLSTALRCMNAGGCGNGTYMHGLRVCCEGMEGSHVLGAGMADTSIRAAFRIVADLKIPTYFTYVKSIKVCVSRPKFAMFSQSDGD